MTTYYFIGIKGTGMGPLAQILHDQGHTVIGSDIPEFTYTQAPLEAAGITILPFAADNIAEYAKGATIIRGNAFDDQHPEVAAALTLGYPMMSYPDAVQAQIAWHTSIAVAGAHGKTSTTGLLAHVVSQVAPTSYLIGDGTGRGKNSSRFFVVEADEYRRHFEDYRPDYAIITNIDFDHPDYYRDIDDVKAAFQTFASHVQKALFVWGEDAHLRELTSAADIYYYGTDATQDDFVATNIRKSTQGSSFDVVFRGKQLGHFAVPVFGQHGILNALAVIAVAHIEHISGTEVAPHLATFTGVKRRFSEKQIGDMTVIDDYAHHPSEITATLDAVRQKYPNKTVVAIFQPHTFTRLAAYKEEFSCSLDEADAVYLTEIFASAREQQGTISSHDLGHTMRQFRGMLTESDISPLLGYDHAVMVFMGAGDIQKYEFAYERLLGQLHPDLQ